MPVRAIRPRLLLRCWLLSSLVLLLASPNSFAELYKWTDANGRTHYSDKKPDGVSTQPIGNPISVVEGSPITPRPPVQAKARKVIMYGASWCGYCAQARKYFAAQHIAYIEYDIDKQPHARQRYDALGGQGVPLILIGDKRLSGFSVESFQALYATP
ncbi:MAG: glutaredoxin family protein [Pseudomonadota bacterium]